MKILFINPSQENIISWRLGWNLGLRDVGYYQPLGILYVATYLKMNNPGFNVKVIDAASPNMPYDKLKGEIVRFNPDIIGISSYTATFVDVLKTAALAKETKPNVHISLGGQHLWYFAKETLQHKIIDSIILGDGELKFSELVNNLKDGKDIERINGVFTRRNIDSLIEIKRSEYYLNDISMLPYPDRELVAGHRYYNFLTINKKMTTIISSRGCPYDCTFCPQGREPYRQRLLKDVIDEIEYCMKRGYTDFFFTEDIFNINKKKVIDFCNEVIRRNLNFSWYCKSRISNLDFEALRLMKKSGCYLINLGIETGSNAGLRQLQKGITVDMVREVLEDCKKIGIKTFGYFMIGLPSEETVKDVENNLSFLISLKTDYININPFYPVPFTPLFDEGVKKGILSYEPWKKYVLEGTHFIPPVWEEYLSEDAIFNLRRKWIWKFYFRPKYIFKQLLEISSLKQAIYMITVAFNIMKGYLIEKGATISNALHWGLRARAKQVGERKIPR